MKKRILSIVACVAIACGLFAGAFNINSGKVANAEVDLTPNFSDNFNSYATTGFIEDDAEFRKAWENELMLNIDGNEMAAADSECKGVAKIIADPTNGAAAGNKVMHLKNFDPIGSFFYIAPKGLRVKDFELTFRVYVMRTEKEPWFGLGARKATNVRYNGTDNMLLTSKAVGKADDPNYNALTYAAMRGYAGAGNPQDKTSDIDTYGDKENPGNFLCNYDKDGAIIPENKLVNEWVTAKYSVKQDAEKPGTNYTYSIITADGVEHRIGNLYYSSKKVNSYGFVSFNACMADMYMDDFNLVNLDTKPAPVLLAPPKVEATVTNITKNSASFDAVVTDPDKSFIEINGIDFVNADDENDVVNVADVTKKEVTGLKPNVKYKLKVTYSFDINDGNGLTNATTTSDVFTTLADDKTDPVPPADGGKKGCGAATVASISAMLGIGLFLFKIKR